MKSLPTNALFLGSADIFVRLLSFITVTYLARTLGPANMGVLAVGMAILAYASIFSNIGLPMLGVRHVAAKIDSIQNLIRRICSARFLLAVITFIISTVILLIWVEEPNTRSVAIIYLFTLFPSALLLEWLFQGLNKMKTLAIGRILGMAVYLLFVMGMVSNSLDLCWVPFAWCFGFLVQTIYYLSSYKKLCISDNSEKRPLRLFEIIKQGIPLGSASLISQVIIQFPFIYLGFFDSTENAGLYSVAFRTIVLMLVIDRVFYTIFFPAISQSYKNSLEQLRERVDWTLKIVTTGSLYIAILAFIAGRNLLPIIFGSEFGDSGLIFQTLLGYFVLTIINSVFTFTLIGMGKDWLYTKSLLVGAVVLVPTILIPLPLSATLTAPISLAVYHAVAMLVMVKHLKQSISINLFLRVLLPMSVAIVIALVIGLLYHLYPALVTITAIIFTLPIIAFSSGINSRDLNYLKELI